MKFVTKVTKSGIARAMASALVLATIITSTGMTQAVWGPNRHDVLIRVFSNDPLNDDKVVGASLLMVADDRANPDHGVSGVSDGAGNFLFHVYEGSYNLEIRHPDYNGRDYHFTVDGRVQIDATLIPLVTNPSPNPTPNPYRCLPTPPRGRPLLNIWPINMSGADCTDYPLISARNVTDNTGYVNNATVAANDGDTVMVRAYVHNGTIDFPENEAINLMLKSGVPGNTDSATIAAEAWANNADRINSSQKGGNVTIDMAGNEYLEYVPGSAKAYNRSMNLIGSVADSVVGSGVSLGNMKGCFEFARIVTFEVRVRRQAPTPPPPTPNPTPNPTPTPTPTPTGCPSLVSPVSGSAFAYNVGNVTFNWTTASNATHYTLDISEDANFSWWWNNEPGITGTSANFSQITNTAHSGGRQAPGTPVAGKTYYWRVWAYNHGTSLGCHSQTWNFRIGTQPTPPPPTPTPNPTPTPTPTPNPTPTPPPAGIIAMEKTVRNVTDNQSGFAKQTNADPGEVVEFQIRVTATNTVNHVLVSDTLPNRLAYVNGSLTVDNSANGSAITNIDLGNMANATKTIKFRSTVAAASQFPDGITTLSNVANLTSSAGARTDHANVLVTKVTPPTPTILLEKYVRNVTDNQVAFVKSTSADPGEVVEFQLKVIVVHGVNTISINDTMPNRLSYVNNSLTIDGTAAGNNLSAINVGNVTNATKTIKFRATVAAASEFAEGSTTLTNVANLTSSVGNRSDSANVMVSKHTPVPPPPPAATIGLEKVVRNVSANQSSFAKSTNAAFGDQVEFQLRVTATGTVNNVKISDVLPNRLAYVSNSLRIEGAAAGNDLNNINVGTLTSGSKNVTFRATVAGTDQFSAGNTTLTNVANLTSSAGSRSDSANVIVNKTVTPNPPPPTPVNPTLSIQKTVRNVTVAPNSNYVELVEASASQTVEFMVVVKNTSGVTATDVRLQDTLPVNPTLNYINNTLTIDGVASSLQIFSTNGSLGNLAANQSKTITFRAFVPTVSSNTTLTNVATAWASNAGQVSDTAQVRIGAVLGGNVDLVMSKQAYNNTQAKNATTVTAKAGDVIAYTLTVKNNGTVQAQNFTFEDNIADILQLADLTSFTGATYDANTKTLRWAALNVPAGATVEKVFVVRVKSPVPTGTDYIMTNIFGNKVDVPVERPFVAPPTGVAGTLAFMLALMAAGGYFLYRRRQAAKLSPSLTPQN